MLGGSANWAEVHDAPREAGSERLSVFLFDWDDTLFPTTALGDKALSPGSLSENSRRALKRADATGFASLRAAAAVPASHVTVLTNACEAWVYRTSRMHLPRVYGLLARQGGPVHLVSARPARLEREPLASDVAEWKRAAVAPMAPPLQRRLDEDSRLVSAQVVGIGDMAHDLEAASILAGKLRAGADGQGKVLVKTVRMRARPAPGELAAELGTLAKVLVELSRSVASSRASCAMRRQGSRWEESLGREPEIAVTWADEPEFPLKPRAEAAPTALAAAREEADEEEERSDAESSAADEDEAPHLPLERPRGVAPLADPPSNLGLDGAD